MSSNGMTRRDLLRIGALGAVGGALTITGLAKIASRSSPGGGSGAGALVATPGAALVDLEELALTTVAGGAREGALTVAEAEVSLGETRARLLAYSGSVPGPLVRVRSGETLRLQVRNELSL